MLLALILLRLLLSHCLTVRLLYGLILGLWVLVRTCSHEGHSVESRFVEPTAIVLMSFNVEAHPHLVVLLQVELFDSVFTERPHHDI